MNFKDFIDNSLQELHQFRQLKEEDQEPREWDKWRYMGFFQNFGEPGNFPNNNMLYYIGVDTLGPPFVTQTMLDAFDFNGDGLVGKNDIAYGQMILSTIIDYGLDNGIENVPPFMIASEWRENWELINEQYGFDFPNPDGFSGTPENPDANTPDAAPSNIFTLGNIFDVIRMVSTFTGGSNSYFSILYPDLYNEFLQRYDFNGDGKVDVLNSSGNNFDSDQYLAYFMFTVLSDRGVDLNQTIPDSLLGVDGFANFIQNYFYTRGESGGLTNFILQKIIDAGYVIPELPTSPPPPPEETPQSQAPPPEIGMA